ncbi:glutathione transferase [Aureococcus anophagefferens]|nr:glutathione transferase [Aureococcus anophagefferens]
MNSPAAVAALLALPRAATSTLVAYYSFDDGTAAEASDSSLDGTIEGATATTGRDGRGALYFTCHPCDYVDFPAAVTANILGNSDRTVCLWLQRDTTTWEDGTFFTYGDDGGVAYGSFAMKSNCCSETVLTKPGGYVYWYENDGSQSFTTRVISADRDYFSIAVDIDDDGDIDVFSLGQAETYLHFYENDGAQSFTDNDLGDVNTGSGGFIDSADIDGDGDVDVLYSAFSAYLISWMENEGSGGCSRNVPSTE